MNITRLTDNDNTSGLHAVYYIPIEWLNIASWELSDDLRSVVIDALTFADENAASKNFFKFKFTEGTAFLKTEEKTTDDGTVYKYQVKLFLPKNYDERINQFEFLNQYNHLVITYDNNENIRLLGMVNHANEKFGCTFANEYGSGDAKGKNGYNCTFNIESFYPAKPVTGFDALTITV